MKKQSLPTDVIATLFFVPLILLIIIYPLLIEKGMFVQPSLTLLERILLAIVFGLVGVIGYVFIRRQEAFVFKWMISGKLAIVYGIVLMAASSVAVIFILLG